MDQKALSSREVIGLMSNGLEMSKDLSWPFLVGLEMTSNQAKENYQILGNSPAMREWIGGRSAKSLRTQGVDVLNKKFEATMQILVDDLRRDKTGFIKLRIAQLVERANTHWAKLLSALREVGGSTLCVDGQYFYDTDHAFGDSGTWKNLLAAGDYAELNVNTANNPTASELSNIIVKGVQHMYTLKDDQGEPINENARKFLVQVPVNMYAALITAKTNQFLNTGSGVVDNPSKNAEFEWIPSVNPRLTDDDVLYIDRIDGVERPFIIQSETDIEISAKAEGSEFEHDNDAHEYGIKANRNVGFAFPQASMKLQLS